MYKTGAELVRYGLEQLNIPHCFATVSDYNHELYHQLSLSTSLRTHKVNHQLSATFMADALSRTSYHGKTGVILTTTDKIVVEGIAEAYISGIPLLVIAGSNSNNSINGIDPQLLLKPVTKACFRVTQLEDIVNTVFDAQTIATSNKPGPVVIEISTALQSQADKLSQPLPEYPQCTGNTTMDQQQGISIDTILNAENPCILVGWGAIGAHSDIIAVAETIAAPVCSVLAGNSAFAAEHPLHAGLMHAPAAKRVLKHCDCLLVIGADSATLDKSELPKPLFHVTLATLANLVDQLKVLQLEPRDSQPIVKAIAKNKRQLRQDWLEHNSKGRVNPIVFFDALANSLQDDATIVTGYGVHRGLTAELLPINRPRGFISPSSAGASGYCIPAVNAIKLANPHKQVIGIVSDDAMIINAMEVVVAVREKLGAIYCLLNSSHQHADNESSPVNWGAFADAMDCGYFPIEDNHNIDIIIRRAFETAAQGQPVILDIHIDSSRNSYYTEYQREKTQLMTSAGENTLSLVKRAIARKISGKETH
jgi:acetolactate synthase-1/2/3 large subunit